MSGIMPSGDQGRQPRQQRARGDGSQACGPCNLSAQGAPIRGVPAGDTLHDGTSTPDLIDSIDAIVWQSDAKRVRHSFVSAGAGRLLGLARGAWREDGAWDAQVHPADRSRVLGELASLPGGTTREVRYRMQHADGSTVDVRDVVSAADEEGGRVLRGVMVVQPARRPGSSDSDAMRRLTALPAHDVLTGLPNRSAFTEHLVGAVARAARRPGYLFAVVAVDLDRFKVINESLGYRAGDEVLAEIGGRLAACLRSGDVVARVAGDEFAVLLDDLEDAGRARSVATRIQEQMAEPILVAGQEILASCSMGMTLSTHGYHRAEDALRDAVTALHRAKSRGSGLLEDFAPAQHEQAVQSLKLETELRRALQRKEFRVHFQPIVRLDTGHVGGFEALVRWEHPERGLVQPSEFIPFTEDSGLVRELGLWTLDQACRQVARWQARPRVPRSA